MRAEETSTGRSLRVRQDPSRVRNGRQSRPLPTIALLFLRALPSDAFAPHAGDPRRAALLGARERRGTLLLSRAIERRGLACAAGGCRGRHFAIVWQRSPRRLHANRGVTQRERAGNIARYRGGARSQFFRRVRGVSHRRTRGARADRRGEVGIRRRGRLRL